MSGTIDFPEENRDMPSIYDYIERHEMTTHEGHPKDDPRSAEELISAVLTEQDEGVAWDAVAALHWRGDCRCL